MKEMKSLFTRRTKNGSRTIQQVSMQEQADIELKLISDPMYLCGARELVGCIARRIGFTDMDCAKITLAVDEALSNIIRHGYNKSFDKPIWIGISPMKATADSIGGIIITIDDEAKQVDPCDMKGRELEDIKPGGLGVHIIHEVMDCVKYEKRAQVGMRMTMTKKAIRPEVSPRLSDGCVCTNKSTKTSKTRA
jgi:serine/threonine-protein kinase RsbW